MRNIRRHSEGSPAIMRGMLNVILNEREGSAIMKRKNTEDPPFKLHRKNHQHDPDNLDFIEKALFL
mgnify:CR=1 FL=1